MTYILESGAGPELVGACGADVEVRAGSFVGTNGARFYGAGALPDVPEEVLCTRVPPMFPGNQPQSLSVPSAYQPSISDGWYEANKNDPDATFVVGLPLGFRRTVRVPAQYSIAPSLSVAMDDLETVGPFATWVDVKRDFGAVGDGIADDTDAIQAALNALGWTTPAVYFPLGAYRITRSLSVTGSPASGGFGAGGVSIMGEAAAATAILWDGPAGEPMLVQNGGAATKYSHLTWDGRGTAGYGVAQWWNARGGGWHDSGTEHSDSVFKDMRIGIMAGRMGANYGHMGSEGQVRRVKFVNITEAALNTGSFNAMNWWVWDSHFVDCGRGVSNIFGLDDQGSTGGAGSMHVYRSLFERSKVADMHIGNSGFFSLHQNVSVGSRRFFQGEEAGNNGASLVLKGNRVLDTTDSAAIVNGNLGPLVLIDNEVRSREGVTSAPVVLTNWVNARDVVSVGNKYTTDSWVQKRDVSDRVLSVGDIRVARDAIASTIPSLPAPSVRHGRLVFSVPSGASAAGIQMVVDAAAAAAASGAHNPIVHIPKGTYTINTTVVVPAGLNIQIVGDGYTTLLVWNGAPGGKIFRLVGPSKATIRDMLVRGRGPDADFFELTNANQRGGRVLLMGSVLPRLIAENITKTSITGQGNPAIKALDLNNVSSFVAVGTGGLGPVNMTGNSRALVQDQWFEGLETALIRVSSGDFTYMSGHMSPADRTGTIDPTQPPVLLDALSGKVTMLSFSFTNTSKTNGVSLLVADETQSTNAMFLACSSIQTSNYFTRPLNKGGNVGLIMARGKLNGAGTLLQLPTQGRDDSQFIEEQLRSARTLVWDSLPRVAPDSATDVRIYRVHAGDTSKLTINA